MMVRFGFHPCLSSVAQRARFFEHRDLPGDRIFARRSPTRRDDCRE